jgi:hypothetical protein
MLITDIGIFNVDNVMPDITGGNVNLRLFKNDIAVGQSMALSDFIEADFAGYFVLGPGGTGLGYTPNTKELLRFMDPAATVFFQKASGAAQTVFGEYFTWDDGGTHLLLAAQRYNDPVVFSGENDVLIPDSIMFRIDSARQFRSRGIDFMISQPSLRANFLTGVVTTLSAVNIRLFKNDIPVSPATVLGDLVEADFHGYAAQNFSAVGFTDPLTNSTVVSAPGLLPFLATSPLAGPQTLYGWSVDDGADLLAVFRFDMDPSFGAPVTITNVGDGVELPDVIFQWGLDVLST